MWLSCYFFLFAIVNFLFLLQNLTLKSYPRVRLKCSFLNAEKSKPQRLQIPCSLNIKLQRKTHFLRSNADRLCPFTSFGVRAPFGCELSNSRMPMNVLYNGLTGGAYSFYFGRTTRLFSQIPKMGTQHNVVCPKGEANGTNYSSKTSNKHPKSPRAFVAQKDEMSLLELASRSSQVKVADAKEVNISSLNGSKADENSVAVNSTQASKGQDQVKQRPRSKRKQNQTSSSSAPKAADMSDSSATKFQAKETKKQSYPSLKVRIFSSRFIVF